MYRVTRFSDSTRFLLEGPDEWTITYRVGIDTAGVLVIRELKIVRRAATLKQFQEPLPKGGISPAVLRRIRLGEGLREARMVIDTQLEEPVSKDKGKRQDDRTVGRPPTLSIAQFRRIAKRWEALARAKDPHPSLSLARELGFGHDHMRQILYRYDRMAARNRVPARKGRRRVLMSDSLAQVQQIVSGM